MDGMNDAGDFVVIKELSSPVEAEIAAGRLMSEGIEAQVEVRGAFGTPILNPGHAGGVVILVKREDAEVAYVLLDTIDEDYEPIVPPEFKDAAELLECPECGSTSKKFLRETGAARMLPRTNHFPERTGNRWLCRGCRHIWFVEVPT